MPPEQLTKLIGKTADVVIFEVEKGAIKKFADAVGDRNPLYWDEEYAGSSRYGSLIAPPGFFGWPIRWTRASPNYTELCQEVGDAAAQAGYGRLLDGAIEYEFFRPVRAGDTLAAMERIANIVEREGKAGKMVFVVREVTYTNQKGGLAAKARQIGIFR